MMQAMNTYSYFLETRVILLYRRFPMSIQAKTYVLYPSMAMGTCSLQGTGSGVIAHICVK